MQGLIEASHGQRLNDDSNKSGSSRVVHNWYQLIMTQRLTPKQSKAREQRYRNKMNKLAKFESKIRLLKLTNQRLAKEREGLAKDLDVALIRCDQLDNRLELLLPGVSQLCNNLLYVLDEDSNQSLRHLLTDPVAKSERWSIPVDVLAGNLLSQLTFEEE